MHPSPPIIEFTTLRGEPHVHFKRSERPPENFRTLCERTQFSLVQIAEQLEVSESTLRKTFKKYVGLAPKAWMSQQRVVLSMRMLREHQPLTEVWKKMGYHDYSHMAKEFKAVLRLTPRSMKQLLEELQQAG